MWSTLKGLVGEAGGAAGSSAASIGGSGKVGADPGGQPCASVRALGQQRPVQRAQRGVNPVEVAAPVRGQKAVGQADLVDGELGIALQVQGLSQVYLKVAVRAGHSLAAVHVDSGHQMFSHFALISVELANSFWPRKLSAAPIGVFFKCKTLFKALVEHFIPRLQVVDKEETVGFPRCPVQLLLWQQGAQLLNNGVQNCMFTRTAALMSRSFCELTQVLICTCRPLMKRVSRAP